MIWGSVPCSCSLLLFSWISIRDSWYRESSWAWLLACFFKISLTSSPFCIFELLLQLAHLNPHVTDSCSFHLVMSSKTKKNQQVIIVKWSDDLRQHSCSWLEWVSAPFPLFTPLQLLLGLSQQVQGVHVGSRYLPPFTDGLFFKSFKSKEFKLVACENSQSMLWE